MDKDKIIEELRKISNFNRKLKSKLKPLSSLVPVFLEKKRKK